LWGQILLLPFFDEVDSCICEELFNCLVRFDAESGYGVFLLVLKDGIVAAFGTFGAFGTFSQLLIF